MTRTQPPSGKWECSKNEFDLTRIESLNILKKKSKKRNLEIAYVIFYGETS